MTSDGDSIIRDVEKAHASNLTLSSDGDLTIHDIEQVDGYGKKESKADGSSELTDFPEGGLRGWSVLAGSFIVQFCCFGYSNSFGVYNDYYVRIYLGEKYTSSQISWIGSVQLLVFLSISMVTGRAFDAGYFYHMIIGGTFLFSFSLFMLSLSHPQQYYQVFLAQGLANSVGMSMLFIPGLAIVSHYFRRRRALALGIAASGTAVGGVVHPIMLNKLFYGRVGFQNGVRASAGLCLGILIIAIPFMKPRLPPKKHESSLLVNIRTFLQEPPYILSVLGMLFVAVGFYFPLFFLQLYAIEHGVDPTLAFYSLAILNGFSFFGRIMPNLVVNKYGAMNTMILCSAGCAITIFCQLGVKNFVGVIVYGVAYGFFSGAYAGLLAPMLSAQAKKDSEIGVRMGLGFAIAGIGGLIGNPIAGALLTSSYIWWRAISFAGIATALGSVCFFGARLLLARQKGTHIV